MPSLREIVRRIRSSEDPAEIDRLTGEYRRLKQAEDVTAITPKPRQRPALVPDPADTDPDAAAIATWPRELRGRLRSAAFNAVIDGNRGQ